MDEQPLELFFPALELLLPADDWPLELLLPAGDWPLELFFPAGDWPLETGEPPTYVSFRHWPDGQVALALRLAQVPLPGVQ